MGAADQIAINEFIVPRILKKGSGMSNFFIALLYSKITTFLMVRMLNQYYILASPVRPLVRFYCKKQRKQNAYFCHKGKPDGCKEQYIRNDWKHAACTIE